MSTIKLPSEFQPLLSTRPIERADDPTASAAAPTRGRYVVLQIGDRLHVINTELYERAATLSMDTLHDACMTLAGLHKADETAFSASGFGPAWARAFLDNLDHGMKLWKTSLYAEHRADALRRLEAGPVEEARALVREIHTLAQAGGIRHVFTFQSSDLGSFSGLRGALWEIDGKAGLPQIRSMLLARGVSEQKLQRVSALSDELQRLRGEQIHTEGLFIEQQAVLQAIKAMLLGDLIMLSTTARAQLPQSRWESYQVGRLLGQPRYAAERREPTLPAAGTTPPAAGTTPPAAGTTLPAAGTTLPAAGTALPAAGTTPPVSTATGTPLAAEAPPRTEIRPPVLTPGSVLFTLPAKDGPALSVVVQPDGSAAWVPAACSMPAPAASPAPRRKTARGRRKTRK